MTNLNNGPNIRGRSNWENTKGIPHILTKYLKSSVHKLIVFCRDTNHLNAMELEVQKWFLKSFRNRKRRTYRVLSSDNENDKNLREFVTAKDDTFIHLLFCIDMLNEGLHVPDVAGVILVRPTESPRVFYQQIGRCIQAGSGNTPIIFDFVNNFRNISANNFIEDINTEVDKENEIRKKHDLPARVCDVHIYDETKEIIELFETIEVTLQSWRVNYNHLQEYRTIHPDRWPVQKEEYPTKNLLGRWCGTQRAAYTKQELSHERIHLLEAIGFMWDQLEAAWQEQYNYVQEYRTIHPDTWPAQKEEYPVGNNVGSWCSTQRIKYNKKELSHERIQLLEDVGFVWDSLESAWQEQYTYLQEYRNRYPDRWPQNREEYPIDNNLGLWCGTQRVKYNKQELSPKRTQLLEAIGFRWDPFESAWQEQYNYLKEYRNRHPDRWPARREEYPVDNNLGLWCARQRAAYTQQELSPERIHLLEAIGFMWDPLEVAWQEQYNYVQEYRKIHPDTWPQAREEYPVGNNLGSWCNTQRRVYTKQELSPEQIQLLEDIGFMWG